MTITDQQVKDSQELVVRVFKSLRDELLGAYGNIEHTRKIDTSPVTVWDVKVEKILSSELQKLYPDIGFEGEETGSSGDRTTYWLVDPIDGTSSFIRGLAYCTNMAALVHEGHVVAAVIYDFVNDVLYTARKGHGAFKDGKVLQVNTSRESGNLVVYSLTRKDFGHIHNSLRKIGVRCLLPMGAAGHAYAMLAEGKIDGMLVVNTLTGLYDNAPGLLLVEEAGGTMLQYDEEVGVRRHEFILGSPLMVRKVRNSGVFTARRSSSQ